MPSYKMFPAQMDRPRALASKSSPPRSNGVTAAVVEKSLIVQKSVEKLPEWNAMLKQGDYLSRLLHHKISLLSGPSNLLPQ